MAFDRRWGVTKESGAFDNTSNKQNLNLSSAFGSVWVTLNLTFTNWVVDGKGLVITDADHYTNRYAS